MFGQAQDVQRPWFGEPIPCCAKARQEPIARGLPLPSRLPLAGVLGDEVERAFLLRWNLTSYYRYCHHGFHVSGPVLRHVAAVRKPPEEDKF